MTKTEIVNTSTFTKSSSLRNKSKKKHKKTKTRIINTDFFISKNINKTELIKTKTFTNTLTIASFNKLGNSSKINNIPNLSEKTELKVYSELKKKIIKVKLLQNIDEGSYNTIYLLKNSHTKGDNAQKIIRVSDKISDQDNIVREKKGIEKQYKFSKKCKYIASIIDYGTVNLIPNKLFDYSIMPKYNMSLKTFLDNKPSYPNLKTVLTFMKRLLKTVQFIHNEGYAHLDLKPSNILLKNVVNFKKPIKNIDFVIIDFGAIKKFKNDKSKLIKKQMASAAFSPPELLKRYFGKKSDIWSFGIISYLIAVRMFFFEANANKIFLDTDKHRLQNKIYFHINNLKQVIKPYHMNKTHFSKYIYPLNINNLDLLINFFHRVFNVFHKERPTATELLSDPIFSLL